MSVSLSGHPEYYTVPAADSRRMLLLAHIAAPRAAGAVKVRAPVRLTAVIDRSGSMDGLKLELVKGTLRFIISELDSTDELGIITYDDDVSEVLELLPMTAANRAIAYEKVGLIEAGSTTNLFGGLEKGVKQVTAQASEESINSVWLFTDGMANCGLTHTQSIVSAMEPYLATPTAPTIFTFGLGFNHNEGMLKAIAETGQGMYYYLERPSSIAPAFAECLGGLLSVVGRKVQLTVTPSPAVRIVQLHSDHLHHEMVDGMMIIRLRDLYSDEERDILFEIEVPSSELREEEPLGVLQLDYTAAMIQGKGQQVCTGVSISRVARGEGDDTVDHMVDMQRNRVRVAKAIKKAKQKADVGKMEEAKLELVTCISSVRGSVTSKQKMCMDLVEDATECLNGIEQYGQRGRKVLEVIEQSHTHQKSCGMHNERYFTSTQILLKGKVLASPLKKPLDPAEDDPDPDSPEPEHLDRLLRRLRRHTETSAAEAEASFLDKMWKYLSKSLSPVQNNR